MVSAHLFALLPADSFRLAAVASASALFAGLWQGMALAAATGLVLRFLPRMTASARFVVWIAVFCVSATVPLIHLQRAFNDPSAGSFRQFQIDVRWSYILAALWALASLVRLGALAMDAVALRALWKGATPVSTDSTEDWGLKTLLTARRIEVCTSTGISRPSVIGFLAPRILVPEWLFTVLSAVELRHIILHETEHLRRRDDWVNLLQRIGLALFPLNPAMFWIDRRLSAEREIACDDGVLARTHAPRSYAASLISIAERKFGTKVQEQMIALALGATGSAGVLTRRRSQLVTRVESILGVRTASHPAFAGGLAAAVLAGIFVAAAGMIRAPELISFGSASASESAAFAAVGDSSAVLPREPASYKNASFHLSEPKPQQDRQRAHKSVRRVVSRSPYIIRPQFLGDYVVADRSETMIAPSEVTSNSRVRLETKPQWVLMTSWEQRPPVSRPQTDPPDAVMPVSRVVVRMPNGKVYATPYAAVPTQAGWLIVQL